MAIENLELSKHNSHVPIVVTNQVTFQPNMILISNMQTLHSPLLQNDMVLYGFIGDINKELNFNEFEVIGLDITFKNKPQGYSLVKEYKIMTKVLIDLQQNSFSDLFPTAENYLEGFSKINNSGVSKISEHKDWTIKNYYFFNDNTSINPIACSDELFLVCKFREDGKFKYGLFSPREVILK